MNSVGAFIFKEKITFDDEGLPYSASFSGDSSLALLKYRYSTIIE
jgi:hypothetical protein